jgi:hypothetical protein
MHAEVEIEHCLRTGYNMPERGIRPGASHLGMKTKGVWI